MVTIILFPRNGGGGCGKEAESGQLDSFLSRLTADEIQCTRRLNPGRIPRAR